MAITTTTRFGLKIYSAGTDPHPNRDEFNALMNLIETQAARSSKGTTAARPAAGKSSSFYWDSDVSRLYFDDGANWKDISTNGGGGAGKPITPDTAGTEGTSDRSARADHTHNLPLATSAAHGAMPSTDKALLNSASATPTPNSLVKLDGNGRAQVAAPTLGGEIANKSYVDAQRDTRAPSDHTHDAAAVTSGTFAVARLPLVTVAANGAMLAADKLKLDNAVAAATASRLVIRDAAGRAQFADPSLAADAATKGYVDAQVGTRALSDHTHSYGALTGIPATFPSTWAGVSGKPTIFATNWASVADKPTTFDSDWANVANKPAIFPSNWANVADKPASFPSSWLTMTDVPTIFATNWANIADIPATFTPSAHTHDWAEVTGKPATFVPSAHSHSGADITSGTISNARLPWATRTASGIMSYQDKALLDDREVGAWANTLVVRDAGGRFDSQRPVSANQVATKDFCDDNTNSRVTWAEFDKRITRGASYSYLRSPDGGTAFACNDSGTVGSSNIYNTNAATGSAWRAVWVNNSGVLGYNLSSRKYKTNERDYVVPLSVLDEITPKWYQLKSEVEEEGAENAYEHVNFIAEDIFDAGLTEYVDFDGEETRENVQTINEQLMVNALWSICQQQQKLIDGLQGQINELKGA
ncbi:minor tail protein [Arthrobacter phage EastWest]|uniref:Minor tail protein n=1 Tax=Arthrobacter phage EastWest TaxID=2894292 RepID=A0AAE8YK49_9CAUD|nr:minor tail protein [Arthrobacter phage EastWest]